MPALFPAEQRRGGPPDYNISSHSRIKRRRRSVAVLSSGTELDCVDRFRAARTLGSVALWIVISIFFVERREDGRWATADTWSEFSSGLEVKLEDSYYFSRNYYLFAILADVRNIDDLTSISEPRGMPADCCDEVRRETENWAGDGHSHSWLSLPELLSFNWTRKHEMEGWVEPTNWARWRQGLAPYDWAYWSERKTETPRTNEEFERAFGNLDPDAQYADIGQDPDLRKRMIDLLGGGGPVTKINWQTPYHDLVKEFWTTTIPRLKALSRSPALDDVRVVFFFDN